MNENPIVIKKITINYAKIQRIFWSNYIRKNIESPYDFIILAEEGIRASIIINFRKYFDVSTIEVAEWLNVSENTVYRWTSTDRNLTRNYSVQLFDLTDLFLYGIDVLESRDSLFQWIKLPNTALGGFAPKALFAIPGGISKVRDLLSRIEYGVNS